MKIIQIGTGYIGISTLIYFTKANYEMIGIDLDKKKVELIRDGILPQQDLALWLKFDTKEYLQKIRMYDNFDVLNTEKNVDAICVAIPTEKDGMPYFDILESVVNIICNSQLKDTLVIIESTVTPGVSEKYIKPFIKNFAIAPRRDWFTDDGKTVETLPRIIGGNTVENTEKAENVLKNVCKITHTCTYKEAELVKACENSLRHVGAMFATQLALAYPNLNTKKILELAGTKWNIPTYYANVLGSSGYCIPVSSKYVVMGSQIPEALTILKETITTDNYVSEIVANFLKQAGFKRIGILGMAYLGDIKVSVECGCLRLLKHFRKDDNIQVNDPLYTIEEIKKISGKDSFNVPEDLDKFDILILTAGHSYYKNLDHNILIEKTKNCKFILDNSENKVWKDVNFKCLYKMTGEAQWMNIPESQ